MKNKSFLLWCLLLITSTTSAQISAYDRPSYPRQQNLPTMDEMMFAPMMKMKQYNANMEYLNALVNWIFDLKEKQTDNQFQSEIDGYYKVLKSYYDKDLAVAGGSLKQMELKIRESIDSYNNRIKFPNVPHNSGNLQTITDAALRSSASSSANIIRMIPKNASITVLSKENGYYKVRYGAYEGYVSELFVK